MRYKKFLAQIMAGLMCVSVLAGCGANGSTSSAGSASGSGSAASDDSNKSITLVLSQRDEWLSTLVDAAESAAKDKGYKMNTVDCQSDVSKAIQFVETARNAGEKAIIVNLVDPSQASEIIDAAGDDMKVVFVNRLPGDMSVLNQNAIYVGSNESEAGMYQGKALAEYFKAKGQTDIKYILLTAFWARLLPPTAPTPSCRP